MKTTTPFKGAKHKQRFAQAMFHTGEVYNGICDPEYASALYLLTADLATWKKAQAYVDCGKIDIPTMLQDADLSSGSAVLVRWAGNLFNGRIHIDPLELLALDEGNYTLALAALYVRRFSLSVNDFMTDVVE
jgi:hypothetical protein